MAKTRRRTEYYYFVQEEKGQGRLGIFETLQRAKKVAKKLTKQRGVKWIAVRTEKDDPQ